MPCGGADDLSVGLPGHGTVCAIANPLRPKDRTIAVLERVDG
jgi:hypothetical protein